MAAALGPAEVGERIAVTRMDVGGIEGYAVDAVERGREERVLDAR